MPDITIQALLFYGGIAFSIGFAAGSLSLLIVALKSERKNNAYFPKGSE